MAGALACAGAEPQTAANLQTGLRLLCNLFRHAPTRAWLALNRATLLDTFAPAAASISKPVPGAWAALLQNMALELSTGANTDLGAEAKAQVLSASGALLTAPTNEDVTFRFALPVCMAALCLPCLGELAWSCRCSLRGLTCICPVSALERY